MTYIEVHDAAVQLYIFRTAFIACLHKFLCHHRAAFAGDDIGQKSGGIRFAGVSVDAGDKYCFLIHFSL